MSESTTTYGPIPTNHSLAAERKRIMESMAMEQAVPRIDRNSSTWQAIKEFMKKKGAEDYMPTLRSKQMEQPETQYARGALDAFDSLLEFAGEEV